MLTALALLAAFQAQTVAGLRIGEPVAEAREALRQSGIKLDSFRSTGVFEAILMLNPTTQSTGSFSACHGRIFAVSANITDQDLAMEMLRDRISSFGQPQVSFVTESLADGSGAVAYLQFLWPERRYSIRLPSRSHTAVAANQNLGVGNHCR